MQSLALKTPLALQKFPTDVWSIISLYLLSTHKLRLLLIGNKELTSRLLNGGGLQTVAVKLKEPYETLGWFSQVRELTLLGTVDFFSAGVPVTILPTFTGWSAHLTSLSISEKFALDGPSLQALPPSLRTLVCDLAATDVPYLPVSLTDLEIRGFTLAQGASLRLKFELPLLTRLHLRLDLPEHVGDEIEYLPASLTNLRLKTRSNVSMEPVFALLSEGLLELWLSSRLPAVTVPANTTTAIKYLPTTLTSLRMDAPTEPLSEDQMRALPRGLRSLALPGVLPERLALLPPELTYFECNSPLGVWHTVSLPRTLKKLIAPVLGLSALPPELEFLDCAVTFLNPNKWTPSIYPATLTEIRFNYFIQSSLADSDVKGFPTTLRRLNLDGAPGLSIEGIRLLPTTLTSLKIGQRLEPLYDHHISDFPPHLTRLGLCSMADKLTPAACRLFPSGLRKLSWTASPITDTPEIRAILPKTLQILTLDEKRR